MTQRKSARQRATAPRPVAVNAVDSLRSLASFAARAFPSGDAALLGALDVLVALCPCPLIGVARAMGDGRPGDVLHVQRQPATPWDATTIATFLRDHSAKIASLSQPNAISGTTAGAPAAGMVVPLCTSTGQLWGWLVGIDPPTHPPAYEALQVLAGLVMRHVECAEIAAATQARLLAAEQAQSRTAELEIIFNTMTDGVFLYSADGHIREMNQGARELLGLSHEPHHLQRDAAARSARYGVREEAGKPLAAEDWPVSRLLRGEHLTDSNAAEFVMDTLDGRSVILSFGGAPIIAADGTISGAVGVCRDITARRHLERAAASQAQELEAVVTAMSDALFVHDQVGHLVRMNPAGQALLAVNDAEVSGEMQDRAARWDLRDAEGQPMPADVWPLARVLRGEQFAGNDAIDVWMHAANGQARLISFSGAPIRASDGTITGAVTLARDVTMRRRLERRTQIVLEALLGMATALVGTPDSASHERRDLHRLVDLTQRVLGGRHISIIRIDVATGGITPIAMIGLPEAWWGRLQSANVAAYLPAGGLAQLLRGELLQLDVAGTPIVPGYHYFDIQTVFMVAAPLEDGDLCILSVEPPDGVALTPADVGLARAAVQLAVLVIERERLLRERTQSQARELALQVTNDQMLVFLGIAGHELRTPVTSLKVTAQLAARALSTALQEDVPPSVTKALERAQGLLATADRQVGKLNLLIGDLLDVTRIQSGKLDLRPALVDVVALARAAVDEQQPSWPDRPLILDLPAKPAPLTCDADRVEQVITNLLTNALKYSPDEQPVTVTVQLLVDGVRVAVTDHGPGIPPADQAHLWELFHQVPGIQQQSGSGVGLGIGLYLCRTIIERHGGRVGVDSEAGHGATFWFTLPLAPEENAL
ncbi:MAG: PAS domain-containing sensor histidine kinase [Ktedonobacterales bacterium]|nr:PAS domain-containing sensor histidine kinase [Ktedonobacterales bacterium]